MTKSITRRQLHDLRARLRAEDDAAALAELDALLSLERRGKRASEPFIGALGGILEEHNFRMGAEEIISETARRYGAIWEEEDVRLLPSALLSLSLAHIAEEGSAEAVSAARAMQSSFSAVSPYSAAESLSAMHRMLCDSSEDYGAGDRETQLYYRNLLLRVAERERISGSEAAEKYAQSLPGLPGRLLGCAPRLYFAVYGALTLLPSALLLPVLLMLGDGGRALPLSLHFGGSGYIIASVLCALLLLFPSAEGARMICDRIFSHCLGYSVLPRTRGERIPDDGKTLVCITSLLFGGDRDGELFDRLERYYLGNRDENLRFALLADLPDSDAEHADGDAAVLAYAQKRTAQLCESYGDRFYLFVRARRQAPDGRWRGWERKRGAVLELIRFCRGESASFSVAPTDSDFPREAKYLITLDADTTLPIGAAQRLVGAMLHPSAEPIIEDGRVVRGHAIIQPRMVTTAQSASATPFAVMCSGGGGSDTYAVAGYDTYQSLFDEGNFCGKGIIDIDAYHRLLCERFPEETVLSHDLLEGIILRCAIDGGCRLSDSTPKNPVSFMTRAHRWIRGDVQAWLWGRHAELDSLSRFKLADNVRHALTPLASLIAAIISAFMGRTAAAVIIPAVLFYIALPPLITLIERIAALPSALLHGGAVTVRSGRIRGAVMLELRRALYAVCTLAYQAARAGDAALRALWRTLVSHRRMLEWTTAAEGDRYSGYLTDYTVRMMPSVLLGVAFMLMHSVPLRLLGVLLFIAPTLAWRLGTPYGKRHDLPSDGERAQLLTYAADIWRFFSDTVTAEENHLPPDNISYLREIRVADRTSPTNIGLYLMSVVAARDLGLIGTAELERRLGATAETLSRLELWHGHLYNWYSVSELSVLSPYVSAVDSGNFVAALITVCSALDGYAQERQGLAAVRDKLMQLLRGADFSVFYSLERGLMHTGINTSSGELDRGFYDIYMSESRTAYYVAVALGQIPPSAWMSLGRVYASNSGGVGMLSWGGTAFEYFMPTLFYLPPVDTAERQSLHFGARGQRSAAYRGVWGKSEGCYCAYDRDGNYRYKAIGVSSLALGAGGGERVYSPYSSYLVMQCDRRAALENLARFRDYGMYGRYGYYESLDLTPSRVGAGHAVVRCYMSHHMGMSLAAIDNVCTGGIFRERMHAMPELAAAESLTDERIPIGSFAPRVGNIKSRTRRPAAHSRQPLPAPHTDVVRALPVSDGAMHVTLCSDGCIGLSYGRLPLCGSVTVGQDLALVRIRSGADENDNNIDISDSRTVGSTAEKYERIGGIAKNVDRSHVGSIAKKTDRSVVGGAAKKAEHSPIGAYHASDGTEQLQPTDDRVGCARVVLRGGDGDAHVMRGDIRCDGESAELLTADGDRLRLIPDGNDNTVLMLGSLAGRRHTSVLLYLEPRLTPEDEWRSHPAYAGLGFSSRFDSSRQTVILTRGDRDGKRIYMCAAPLGTRIDDFTTKRRGLLPERYTESDVAALLDRELGGGEGVCISPTLALRTECIGSFAFLISVGRTEAQAVEAIEEKRRLLGAIGRRMPTMRDKAPDICERLLGELVTAAVYGKEKPAMPLCDAYPVTELWRFGVSGDVGIGSFFLSGDGEESGRGLRELMRCAVKLYLHGFPLDLVFVYEGGIEYYDRRRDMLLRAAESAGADFLIGARSGIHIVPYEAGDESVRRLFTLYSAFTLEVSGSDTAAGMIERLALQHAPAFLPAPSRHVSGGAGSSAGKSDITHEQAAAFVSDSAGRADGHGDWRFDSDGGFTVDGRPSPVPWSYPLGGCCLGTLVTDRSFGFTWMSNSRELRLTPWSGDEVGGLRGEDIVTVIGGCSYSLSLCSESVTYSGACAIYRGSLPGHDWEVKIGCEARLPVKLYSVSGLEGCELRLSLCMREGAAVHTHASDCDFYTVLAGGLAGRTVAVLRPSDGVFALTVFSTPQGASASDLLAHSLIAYLRERYSHDGAVSDAIDRRDIGCGITMRGGFGETDALLGLFLPHQVYYSRMRGKTGFAQPGGAYGFRDQLQDAGALIYADPRLVRCHIVRCAARQYREGDVMHWWHDVPRPHGRASIRGVRTRCSDDRFWLPYIISDYIAITGDGSVLDVPVPYLSSEPLSAREGDRYEDAVFTGERESVYEHCMHAMRTVGLGLYGLPLIGSCDWNDGLSGIGRGGGVSVWLGFFLRVVIGRMLPMCERMGEYDDIAYLASLYRHLTDATLDGRHRSGGFYIRAYYADGTPLGCESGSEPVLDSIAQSWAYFAAQERGETERFLCGGDELGAELRDSMERELEYARGAVRIAYERLFDPSAGTVALLSTPLRCSETHDPGYICGYPDGMRENGGQYTHAAVWLARALIRSGASDEGIAVIRALDPSSHRTAVYLGEPYAAAGDVCTCGETRGMAGWTQYTGAAGWYYRLLLEDMLGYREHEGYFTLSPCAGLPQRLSLTVSRHSTVWRITLVSGVGTHRLDGREYTELPSLPADMRHDTRHDPSVRGAARLPFDGGEHTLTFCTGV